MFARNLLFCLVCALLWTGCGGGDTGAVAPQPENNGQDNNGQSNNQGNNGQVQCPALCTLGEVNCEGDTLVMRCQQGPEDCPVPVFEACGEDQVCQEGACVPVSCPEESCTLGEQRCTEDGDATLCVRGADGCGVEQVIPCQEGTVCRDGVCALACQDADGDGFGLGCEAGPDCDDGDPGRHPGATELCNQQDDDCDGDTDEGFEDLGAACEEGVGACAVQGVLVCGEDGLTLSCGAQPGAPALIDLCGNGLDDDCDGDIDEDHPAVGSACGAGLGACAVEGAWVCSPNGLTAVCDAAAGLPSPELCDGVDNDCDGDIDEGFAGLGGACSAGVGACARPGTLVCNGQGDAVVCDAQPGAAMDVDLCGNGLDDDCDGQVDEGYPEMGDLCSDGVGQCRAVGVRVCAPDMRQTVCSAQPATPGPVELCGNGLDDDCDGDIDEGFESLGSSCDAGIGACGRQGAFICSPNRRGLVCSAQAGQPQAEICDGIDNNCDGQIDEGFAGLNQPCMAGQGICQRMGVRACSLDRLGTACTAEPGQPLEAELCGNNLDDDCDGDIDEGFEGLGQSCAVGQGICRRSGTQICAMDGSGVICDAQPGTDRLEACDGLDNNCDGVVDGPEVCGACQEDSLEPNNSAEQATPLSHGQRFTASSCFFDRDVYALQVQPGDAVVLNVLFAHEQGDLDVVILRDGQSVNVTGGLSFTDNEQVKFVVNQPGQWVAVLGQASGDGAVDYRLSAQIGPGLCDDDVFEDDDDAQQARAAAPGVSYAATACGSDEAEGGDWYALGTLEFDTLLQLNATFTHNLGDVDIALWRDGEQVAQAASSDNNESLEFYVQEPGDYYAQVFLFGDTEGRNEYSLRYQRQDGVCRDDAREPDDGPGEANPLNEAITAIDGRLCEGDEDWFLLNRPDGVYEPGDTLQVNLRRDRRYGSLLAELYLEGQEAPVRSWEIETGEGLPIVGQDQHILRHTVTTSGRYLVRLLSRRGQPGYQLVHVQGRSDACRHDVYETDGFLDVAPRLEPGREYELTLCLGAPLGQPTEFDLVNLGTLSPGAQVTAMTTFEHAQGNVELALYHQEGASFVALSQSTTDNESISFVIEDEGTYFLASWLGADGPGQSDGITYRLRFDVAQ